LPDFLVIGAQRAGTSSLYKYLGHHPLVIPSLRKETEYLSRRYGNGIAWYRAHFPLQRTSRRATTFEATPDYLYWPTAARRAATTLPDARFIVLLRDPTERAFSHYRHMVRLGFETRTFEEALQLEEERIAGDRSALDRDEFFYARAYLRFSYFSRGLYATQLTRWFAEFPRDRFLIVFSDEFYRQTADCYQRIVRFLNLPPFLPTSFLNYSYRGRPRDDAQLEDSTRLALAARYAEATAELVELIGCDVPWVQ
jgi:hypothetical protein